MHIDPITIVLFNTVGALLMSTGLLALTAGATQEERDNCQQCGMTDFVAKPVDFAELVSVLCHWLLKQ